MRSFIYAFLFCMSLLTCAHAYTPPTPVKAPTVKDRGELGSMQVKSLDELIGAAKQTLVNLHELQEKTVTYLKLQERYLENTKDSELLYRMTKASDELLAKIQNDHLGHAFDKEFLDELAMLAKIYHKIGLPRP